MKKFNFTIILLLSLTVLFSCQRHMVKKTAPATIDTIENRYFSIDFEKEPQNFSEVNSHFFTTFPHDDPTEGNVVYDRKLWVNKDMFKLEKNDGLYLYIKNRNDEKGFDSFRFTTKSYYNLDENTNKILFVFKGKLPSGKSIWPAWWLNGSRQDEWTYQNTGIVETDEGLDKYSGKGHFYDTPSGANCTDWPGAGEIDIIETINGDNLIHNTLHTCPQMCNSEWNNSGIIGNCANAKPGDPNAGCSGTPYPIASPEGTFACLWGKKTIQFFYWEPGTEVRQNGGPLSKNPQPEQWRSEYLKNEVRLLETDTPCDSEQHGTWQCESCKDSNSCVFKNMKMIFNITLCGKWAGAKFDNSDNPTGNCQEYVLGKGRSAIHNQFIKIEYVSVNEIE